MYTFAQTLSNISNSNVKKTQYLTRFGKMGYSTY